MAIAQKKHDNTLASPPGASANWPWCTCHSTSTSTSTSGLRIRWEQSSAQRSVLETYHAVPYREEERPLTGMITGIPSQENLLEDNDNNN